MIDWTRVAQLKAEVGAEDFDEVVGLFLEEVEETLAPLRAGRLPQDQRALLHFLKGSALNLGFGDLARFCAAGERSAEPIAVGALLDRYDSARALFLRGPPAS